MIKPFPPEGISRRATAPFAAVLASCLALTPACAETKLTELNGQWLGSGTDRDLPFAAAQPTRCQTRVTADLTHMTSDMKCSGAAGLNKRVRLSIAFAGNRFTGSAEQTSTLRGSGAPPKQRTGSVSGSRNADTATFDVRFPGLTPNAHVVLELTSPTSFAMRISSLGATLTKVDFHRPAAR